MASETDRIGTEEHGALGARRDWYYRLFIQVGTVTTTGPATAEVLPDSARGRGRRQSPAARRPRRR